MRRRSNTAIAIAILAFCFAALARPAEAQLGWTFVGVGEFDTDDVYLVHAGVSVSPRVEGWTWIAGVSAHWLQYPIPSHLDNDATRSITAVVPSVGIKNGFNGGSFSARVGYSFSDRDDDTTVPVFTEAGSDGVVNTAQLDYWGSGSWAAQAIGSYNYGSESFWGRGRLAKRLFSVGDAGSLSLGGEAAYLTSDNYDATKVGGVVMFNPGRGTQLNAAIGRKLDDGDDATYFTFELVLFPR